MKRILLAALVGVLVSVPVWGYDEKNRAWIFSMGQRPCSAYLGKYGTAELQKDGESFKYRRDFGSFFGFLQGYATGLNVTKPGAANFYGMNAMEMAAWVASWCRDNPSKNISDAMEALTNSRFKK